MDHKNTGIVGGKRLVVRFNSPAFRRRIRERPLGTWLWITFFRCPQCIYNCQVVQLQWKFKNKTYNTERPLTFVAIHLEVIGLHTWHGRRGKSSQWRASYFDTRNYTPRLPTLNWRRLPAIRRTLFNFPNPLRPHVGNVTYHLYVPLIPFALKG